MTDLKNKRGPNTPHVQAPDMHARDDHTVLELARQLGIRPVARAEWGRLVDMLIELIHEPQYSRMRWFALPEATGCTVIMEAMGSTGLHCFVAVFEDFTPARLPQADTCTLLERLRAIGYKLDKLRACKTEMEQRPARAQYREGMKDFDALYGDLWALDNRRFDHLPCVEDVVDAYIMTFPLKGGA